jgi:outer membrane protein OmpA-like peptidoglycan-associated protein
MVMGIALLPAVLLTSGCATKDWVRDLFTKRQAEVDQRFGQVEGRMSESSQRIEGVSAQVGEVRTQVGEVRGRADSAFDRAQGVDQRLTRLWANRHNQKVVESMDVYFGFDQSDLSDGAQTALAGLVKELKANPALIVALEGYTDPKGALEYNYQLSRRRVEAVRRYLAQNGIQLSRVHSIGFGPIADRGQPDEKKRRVTVTLLVDQD